MGGAALVGAIGIVGIAAVQGLGNIEFPGKGFTVSSQIECCAKLENKLLLLEKDVKDEEEDQTKLESNQRTLCNLVSNRGKPHILKSIKAILII